LDEKLIHYKQYICTEYKHLGGVISLKKELLPDFSQLPFDELFNWRYSLRNFADSEVDFQKVREAVDLARKAPSACNRQACKAYIINDKNVRNRVAKLHMGVNGFDGQLSTFIIITSDIKCFGGAGERNQAFVDGGLFAMSVLMSLHYKGLGTIPLHWGVEKRTDVKLRRIVGISDSEAVIMLIGIGNYPDEFNVAKSCRRDIKDICVII
jgi:nitroreductase